jgi:hypothetical protein
MRIRRAASLLPFLLLLPLAACELEDAGADDASALESSSAELNAWEVQGNNAHLYEHVYGSIDVGERDAWPLWVSGSLSRPVHLRFKVSGFDGSKVRVAVLGPIVNGSRATLGSAGYASPTSTATVDLAIKTTGQILVVVGSYNLASFAGYDLFTACKPGATADQCNPWRVDSLSLPKTGALVGKTLPNGQQLVSAQLNGGLSAISSYEVELWRTSAPGLHSPTTLLGTSESSGSQVNWIFPANKIKEGDDLLFRVKPGYRLPYADGGVWARFATKNQVMARLDAIDYSDLGGITIQGVAAYFEAHDFFVLTKTSDGSEVDSEAAIATLPGQPGNGLGSFGITMAQPFDDDGGLNPNLPHDGDILELSRIDAGDNAHVVGCFEYCNDLAGDGSCTAQKVACP